MAKLPRPTKVKRTVTSPAEKASRPPRTVTGKKASPGTRAKAEHASLEGLMERNEEGHRKAGREPDAHALVSSGARSIAIGTVASEEDTGLLLQGGEGDCVEFERADFMRVRDVIAGD